MMNRTRQNLKKAVVTAMGASLVVSGSSTVFAAGSYQETEKTALANVVSNRELSGNHEHLHECTVRSFFCTSGF